MHLEELVEPDEVKYNFEYHGKLNPKIWDGAKLKPEVASKLTEIAEIFIDFLKIPNLDVEDIIITGSMANFNWTKFSDIDLHVLVDLTEARESCPDLLDEYLQAKKKLWNDLHKIDMYGFDVELYAQDIEDPHVATGIYSLQNAKWLVIPKKVKPDVNDSSVKVKVAHFMNMIDSLENGKCDDPDKTGAIKEKIRKLRQTGLEKVGIYSTENLAFKYLRNSGYLDKLDDCYRHSIDYNLSLN